MDARQFKACITPTHNGAPPASFLNQLLDWALGAPDEIFAPNAVPVEAFSAIKSSLATSKGKDGAGTPVYAWESLLQRKAALLELMRVHAGFESSWNWNEGVDKSNRRSMTHKENEEAGIFQLSFDSELIRHDAMMPFAVSHGIDDAEEFIVAMKGNHPLVLEYYARLVRISIAWAGPLLRHGTNSVYPWLSRKAVVEFESFLK